MQKCRDKSVLRAGSGFQYVQRVLETVRVGTLLDKKHRFLRRSWDFKTLRIALSLFSYLPSLLSLKLTTISCSVREQRLAVTLCTICDLSQLGSRSLTETIVRRKSRDAKKPIRVPLRQAPITITTIKPTNLNRKGIKDILWPPAAWLARNAHAYPRCSSCPWLLLIIVINNINADFVDSSKARLIDLSSLSTIFRIPRSTSWLTPIQEHKGDGYQSRVKTIKNIPYLI